GLLTAFAVEPAHQRLVRLFGGRRALAATVSLVLVCTATIGLVGSALVVLATELVSGIAVVRQWAAALPSSETYGKLQGTLGAIGITPNMITERVVKLSDRAAETATGLVSLIVGSTFSSLGAALIAVLTAFQVLADPKPIERRLEIYMPLHPRTT